MVEIVRYPDTGMRFLLRLRAFGSCKDTVWIFPDVNNIVPVPAIACRYDVISKGRSFLSCYVLSCGLIPCDVTFIYSLFAHSRVLEETSTT